MEAITTYSFLVPLLSSITGGLIAVGGQLIVHKIKEKPNSDLDKKRKETLLFLLDPEHMPMGVSWRKIELLQRVIGASESETKRLLIEIGARGSTLQEDVWALTKHKPLPRIAGVD
ncbi:MAG: hypothetical protein AAF317_05290 [Pseudomonadota bacterium]